MAVTESPAPVNVMATTTTSPLPKPNTAPTILKSQMISPLPRHNTTSAILESSSSDSTRTSETLTEKDLNGLAGAGKGNRRRWRGTRTLPRNRKLAKAASPVTSEVEAGRSVSPGRLKTFANAFKHLCNLTPKQVDDFMASYVIYNLDWEDEEQMIKVLGPDYQDQVGDCLKSYYGVINHLCALGDVEKMYIPPVMDMKASVRDNQLLYEESVARDLGLQPGDRVLDLGCGRGRVAAHMSKYSGAEVTGLNIDPNSVAQARTFNQDLGLDNTFVVKDFNELPLPFEDESFDGFYNIQAFSLVKDLPALFKEVYRVLKPGGKFSALDWVKFPSYDPSNPEHAELMARVKPLIGAVGTPTPASMEKALTDAGFKVTKSDNASVGGLQAPLIDRVDIYFRAMRQFILASVKLRILPPHFKTLINRLCLDGQAFVKMDQMRLITTSYRIIAQKPFAKQAVQESLNIEKLGGEMLKAEKSLTEKPSVDNPVQGPNSEA